MARSRRLRLFHTVSPDEHGMRLDLLVGGWLAGEFGRTLSKSAIRKLIIAGAIRQADRPVRRPASVVIAGAQFEAAIDADRVAGIGSDVPPADSGRLTFLYEDDDLIAVAKPAGVLMHASADRTRPDVFNAVRRLLARRGGASHAGAALPYLGLHHRLDVETSGVVLFTKREQANGGLAAQFERGEVVKVYHAIVARPPRQVPGRWRVENRLAAAGRGRRARVERAPGGARAATEFTVLETLQAALLVEARPETGRKHQIRAHLAGSHVPILGDTRYGSASRAGGCVAARVMLHACRLSLRHPVTGAPLTIACPYSSDFAELLDCLRRGSRTSQFTVPRGPESR